MNKNLPFGDFNRLSVLSIDSVDAEHRLLVVVDVFHNRTILGILFIRYTHKDLVALSFSGSLARQSR